MHVNSPDGDFVIKPVKVTDDPAEVGPVDLLLFCVKSYDVPASAKILPPMMGSQTVILPVQNGIGHVETIGEIVGAEHVLGGLSLIKSHLSKPGLVQHYRAPDTLEFGEIERGDSARCRENEQLLTVDGFEATGEGHRPGGLGTR